MPDPVYKVSDLTAIRRIVQAGFQPLHVEVIDNRYLLFTFPGDAINVRAEARQ